MFSGSENSGPPFSVPAQAGLSLFTSKIPLFHAACLFAVGIVITQKAWLQPGLLLVALLPVALLCCLAATRAQRVVWIPLAALWLLLGAWCSEMEPHPRPAPGVARLSDGLLRTVEGTVTSVGSLRTNPSDTHEAAGDGPSQRIDLSVSSIEVVDDTRDAQTTAEGGLRLTVRWPRTVAPDRASRFRCGERIRVVVRLLPPEVYRDPGAWNRADYLVDQGITTTASLDADRIERVGEEQRHNFSCQMAAFQHAASERLLALSSETQQLPPILRISHEDAAMLAAMVAGDRSFLTHSLRAGFERTGSFHMLVVSGFHIAILAGCIFWIARRIRLRQPAATLITIAGSLGYALFTGFATPVQRSLWMVTLYLLGRLFFRDRNPLNTIGFAALCLLVVSPRSLLDAGLQMTLLAVIAVCGVAAPLLTETIHPYLEATRDLRAVALDVKLAPRIAQFRVILRMVAGRLRRVVSAGFGWRVFPAALRIGLRCVELVVVALAAELAMMLPMAIYFHRITVIALPVNIFILPLLTILLPVAFLMLLALLAWPAAAIVPAAIVALLLHLAAGLVHFFGSLALADLRIPAPHPWQALAFCALLAGSIVLAHRGKWERRAAWAALALAAFASVAPRAIEHPRDALLVEALDVGQGDSLLLITPDGKTLLVDGGGFAGGPYQTSPDFDIGEGVVSPALWARGIRHLDAVALSHAHSDHMDGLPAVLRNFRPAELWVGNNPHTRAYDALLDEARSMHIAVHTESKPGGYPIESHRGRTAGIL